MPPAASTNEKQNKFVMNIRKNERQYSKQTMDFVFGDFFVFVLFCSNRVLGLSTAGGGERHIGQDGQGRAGQLRGHVLVVVILAAELPSRQGVMHKKQYCFNFGGG